MGLSINGNFIATRVLDIKIPHIRKAAMNYLGLFGETPQKTLLNNAPGDFLAPVSGYEVQNQVLGPNYMTTLAENLSGGVQANDMPKQLASTVFCAFTCGDIPAGSASSIPLVSLWGTNPSTVNNGGRFSLGLYKTNGRKYINLRWGLSQAIPIMSCVIELDWDLQPGVIFAIGSRNSDGRMCLEVRAGGETYKQDVTVTPVEIPKESTLWRLFVGQISSYPITDLKIFSAASWSDFLTESELSEELDVMATDLLSHLVK